MEDISIQVARALADHGPWLRGLARCLVREEDAAEDLVQDTWLRALQHPPRDASRWRFWLGRVLRNRFLRTRDRDRAEAIRDRNAARSRDVPATVDVVERAARQRDVMEAVLALAEPARATLLLRFVEDLPPRAIARRMMTPVETTKSRLRRGLAELRRELERRRGPEWRAGLAPLLIGPESGGSLVAGAGIAGTLPGVLSMKTASLILGVFGLALAIWFGLRSAAPDGKPANRPLGDVAASEERAVGSVTTSREDVSPLVTVPFTSPIRGDDAAATEAAPLPGSTLELVAWNPVAGSAVAEAEIAILSEPGRATLVEATEIGGLENAEAAAWAGGERHRSDERGRLVLGRCAFPLLVAVRKGPLAGHAFVSPTATSPVRVEVTRSRIVRIRTVDGTGRPLAGIPVQVMHWNPPSTREYWRGRTAGPEGEAVAAVPEFAFTSAHSREHLQATFKLPLATAERISLDPEAADQTVVLTLPPTTNVDVEVLTPQGAPFDGPSVVRLVSTGETGGDVFRIHVVQVAPRGRVCFGHVGLGVRLQVRVEGEDRRHAPGTAEARASGSPGTTTTLAVRLGAERPVIAARLLDARRQALPGRKVTVLCRAAEGGRRRVSRQETTTDDAGRVTVPFTIEGFPEAAIGFVAWQGIDPNGHPLGPQVWTTLQTVSLGPRIDLGDLVLGDPPVLAAGTVVDEAGCPVPGAEVLILPPGTRELPDALTRSDAPRTTADDEGRFRFLGPGPGNAPRLALLARARGYVTERIVESLVGAEDVRITLREASRIEGRIVADPGIPLDRLAILAMRSGARGAPESGSVMKDGSFRIDDIARGTWDLHLLADRGTVHAVQGVDVAAPGAALDPRLSPLDLRGALGLLRLRVTDEDGDPLQSVDLRPLAEDALAPVRMPLDTTGAGVLLLAVKSATWTVTAPGFTAAEVLLGAEEQRVILRRGLTARLWISASPSLPLPWIPQIVLTREDGPRWESPRRDVVPGELAILVPAPGRYRVDWWIASGKIHGATVRRAPGQEPPLVITFEEGSAAAKIEIPLDLLESITDH